MRQEPKAGIPSERPDLFNTLSSPTIVLPGLVLAKRNPLPNCAPTSSTARCLKKARDRVPRGAGVPGLGTCAQSGRHPAADRD